MIISYLFLGAGVQTTGAGAQQEGLHNKEPISEDNIEVPSSSAQCRTNNQDGAVEPEYEEMPDRDDLEEKHAIKQEVYQPMLEPISAPPSPSYEPATPRPLTDEEYVSDNETTDWSTKSEQSLYSETTLGRKRRFCSTSGENQTYSKKANTGPGNLCHSEYSVLGAMVVPVACFISMMMLPVYSINIRKGTVQLTKSLSQSLEGVFRPKQVTRFCILQQDKIYQLVKNPLRGTNIFESHITSDQGEAFYDCRVPSKVHSFGGTFAVRSLTGDSALFGVHPGSKELLYIDGSESCLCNVAAGVGLEGEGHSAHRHTQEFSGYGFTFLGGYCTSPSSASTTIAPCPQSGYHVSVVHKNTNPLLALDPNLLMLSASSRHIEILLRTMDSNDRLKLFLRLYNKQEITELLLEKHQLSEESAGEILKHNTVKVADIQVASPFESALIIIPLVKGKFSYLLTPALVSEMMLRWHGAQGNHRTIQPVA